MDNMTLLIDPETRDLVFDDSGMLVQIYDEETTVQNVRHTLLTWKEEFFADDEHGTDYERVIGKSQNEIDNDEIEEIIRDAVFQEPEVSRIDSMSVTYENRRISVDFSATLENGESITLEVTV